MSFDPDRHHRRSIRLPSYDYSLFGCFFVTICTGGRECIFGEVVEGAMQLNLHGRIVFEEWDRSKALRPELDLGAFVVMPNHVHGIVTIESLGAHGNAPRTDLELSRSQRSLATFIGGFKGAVTRRIHALPDGPGTVWQRNYYEHVIRDNAEFKRILRYIDENPGRWAEDEYNPNRTS